MKRQQDSALKKTGIGSDQSTDPVSANLADSVFLLSLKELPYEASIHSFMLALAAFQRGLEVTFHYDFSWHELFKHFSSIGGRADNFSISDGNKTHYFSRSAGDLISLQNLHKGEDKQMTKVILNQAGVRVPPGLLVLSGDEPDIDTILQTYAEHSFVLKPLLGSLAEGVIRDLKADQVKERIGELNGQPHLLEVYLKGRDVRVYVVADKVVFAYQRLPACVVGDGQSPIKALIDIKNRIRSNHPVYKSAPIRMDTVTEEFLANQSLTLDSVPPKGKLIFLNSIPELRFGGQFVPVELSEATKEQAVLAAQTMDYPVTGMDMILVNDSAGKEQSFVLELNQRPFLSGQLWELPLGKSPQPNLVAEAMVDYYFPDSINNRRLPSASFQMREVINLLRSRAAAKVSLPVIQDDWHHYRYVFVDKKDKANKSSAQKTLNECLQLGIHAHLMRFTDGRMLLDTVAPQGKIDRLLKLCTYLELWEKDP
ncbi:hypothetical protein [Desulforhopalus singaporensis]|uniref:D-alanine-D-alanine ligase n=1 Tax=Desulforhopalus singaporensis TaxID=91360 RepID=A0A1H0VJG2_9BACT|nr:hypothetical protein [Desulforhopalus singaporensis]SDP78657.1 D-alanine-D-alanine ligase [Desulforhopalus singaporensis]